MTKKNLAVSICLLGALGLVGALFIVREARACTDCDPPAANAVEQGHACSLDPAKRQQAADEFAQFNKRSLSSVRTSIVASYTGDKAHLAATLDRMIEREASCCAHLDITKRELADGFEVTIDGNREAIDELVTMLEMAR